LLAKTRQYILPSDLEEQRVTARLAIAMDGDLKEGMKGGASGGPSIQPLETDLAKNLIGQRGPSSLSSNESPPLDAGVASESLEKERIKIRGKLGRNC
jgi:hypothetical protein